MTARTIAPSCQDDALHRIARRLCDAIDDAVRRGMHEQADRLAANAIRLALHSSRLADRLARLRLSQGDPDAAMAILDSCAADSSSTRLLRIACLLQLGRGIEAHLQAIEWSRQSTAPLAARRMLALMEIVAEDEHAATAALTRNLQHVEDPDSLALLTLLCVKSGRTDQVHHWIHRLRQASIVMRPAVDVQLLHESLGMNSQTLTQPVQPSPVQVATLAMEIAASPETLPILVQAQEAEFRPAVVELIYAATKQAVDDLTDSSVGFEAIVRLARLLDRNDEALDWARRGLQSNPMSAPLALLLAELEPEQAVTDGTEQRKAA